MFFVGIPSAAIGSSMKAAALLFSLMISGMAALSVAALFFVTVRLLRP